MTLRMLGMIGLVDPQMTQMNADICVNLRHLRIKILLLILFAACATAPPRQATPFTIVLGIAQDGGYPQAGCNRPDCIAAWRNPKLRQRVASLAIVDPQSHQRWIIDATPDFGSQLRTLDEIA